MHRQRFSALITALIGAAVAAALIVLVSPFGSDSPSPTPTDAAEHSSIKLFFRQNPDLMSEGEVLQLKPDVTIYQ